jgi:DNA integrity scanning protein DisA with diadenylate cyclase activity
LTEETDALPWWWSEETGNVSLAMSGKIIARSRPRPSRRLLDLYGTRIS